MQYTQCMYYFCYRKAPNGFETETWDLDPRKIIWDSKSVWVGMPFVLAGWSKLRQTCGNLKEQNHVRSKASRRCSPPPLPSPQYKKFICHTSTGDSSFATPYLSLASLWISIDRSVRIIKFMSTRLFCRTLEEECILYYSVHHLKKKLSRSFLPATCLKTPSRKYLIKK